MVSTFSKTYNSSPVDSILPHKTGPVPSNSGWHNNSKQHPCPVCGKPDACRLSDDGQAVWCRRATAAPPGARLVKKTPEGIVVRFDDPLAMPLPTFKPEPKPAAVKPEKWQQRVEAYRLHAGDQIQDLADRLGVDAEALRRLRCGWDQQRSQWTFPTHDGQGNVVGISTRLLVPAKSQDGKAVTKRMITGSRQGLFHDPDGWADAAGPILLVEGASDTAAAMSMGLAAIGRPSNRGGVDKLADLLRGVDPKRQIIVVGENDAKADGQSPGREGAISTAEGLADALGRPVLWAMPPEPTKDTREYLQANGRGAGALLVAALLKSATKVISSPGADVEPLAQPVGEARTLDDWRAEAATHREAMATTPGLHLDRSPTGSGKTYNATEACKLVASSLTVLPTHANCRERVEEMQQQGVDAVAYPELSKDTCQRFDEAGEVQRLGLAVGQTICQGCEFAKACQYQQQLKAASQARHRVATHERLRTSGALAYGKKTGEGQGAPIDLVVVDEMPTDVLAPTLAVPVDDLLGVRTLAHSTAFAHYIERDDAQRDFAKSLLAVLDRVDAVCSEVTATGRHTVDLGDATEPPERWQWLLLKAIRKVGRHTCKPTALRLITRAATGDLARLDIVTDITAKKVKQEGGTTAEQQTHRHYLVGRFKPDIDDSTPVIMLDATGRADDIEAATGREVVDHTPAGHLEAQRPIVQIAEDITRGKSPRSVANSVVRFLVSHPDVKALGVIGHKPHIDHLLDLLPKSFRKRVAKVAYFGQGPDRGSNDWHQVCDHGLVLGTPRPNPGDVRRWLVQHNDDEAAAMPDGDWGTRRWQAVDAATGRVVEVQGRGYRNQQWHQAHTAICQAALLQSIGRWRALLKTGCPVTVISTEPTGNPVAPAGSNLPASVVGTVQSLERLAGQIRAEQEGCRSDIFPIRETYSENVTSDLPADLCLTVIMGDHTVGERQAKRRLADAVDCGMLTRPKRGWYAFPQPDQPQPVVAADTVEVTCTPPAAPAVITAAVSGDICPPDPTPEDEMHSECAPADVDLTDADREMLFDERSAIMEHDGGLDRETADRLAAEAIFGRDAAARMFSEEPPADLITAAVERLPGRLKPLPPAANRFSKPEKTTEGCCTRCGHDRFRQSLIHGGRSVRQDCARCDYFHSFPRWNPAGYDPKADPVVVHQATTGPASAPPDAPVVAGANWPKEDTHRPVPVDIPGLKNSTLLACSPVGSG